MTPGMNPAPDVIVGLDVQATRGCPYVAIRPDGITTFAGWVGRANVDEIAESLLGEISKRPEQRFAFGIDAPRCALTQPRRWYWHGGKNSWRPRGAAERGWGRHCEIVVSAHRLANPQWSPLAADVPAWMTMGFRLFEILGEHGEVFEVFPSASYAQLRDDPSVTASIRIADFWTNQKDMLDALVAAITVREYLAGRGCAVGGGDGFGSIILPRLLKSPIEAVARWP